MSKTKKKIGKQYPWRKLEVGQSFLTRPVKKPRIDYANLHFAPLKFTARPKGNRYRIWRIE